MVLVDGEVIPFRMLAAVPVLMNQFAKNGNFR